ncbi:hypothetical protein CHK_2296 [Christensenella hongkongensis]|uniref:Uncharacterized protein n=1 Tax=Christensenella hongkongensis TaxID=270498 RepID=A0A0M2NDG9_9FIRM|nr:hypothetical protein CHK_2296 [Christensenella hongkongensis]
MSTPISLFFDILIFFVKNKNQHFVAFFRIIKAFFNKFQTNIISSIT